MGDFEESEVLEGFICPICKFDLGKPNKLLSHFQEEHSDEQDLIKTFKDILDKAKKKILKQDHVPEFSTARQTPSSSFESAHEPQEIGVIRSHKEDFDQIREERLQRIAVPTNQIIIRLEKLLDKMPNDPLKRKTHEQNIVPWIDGTDVKRCPNCAGLFHVARRQHHCRTCGSVMCNDCSRFMSLMTARKLLDKNVPEDSLGSSGEQDHLRLCIHCLNMLEIREERRESKNVKPIISQFYERLSQYRSQADSLVLEYRKMGTSLNCGESTYELTDAQNKKIALSKLVEHIDALSTKIAVLGKDAETPPQGQALKLQAKVRETAAAYLQNRLYNLPELPTEAELKKIQEKRREEITAKIQEEKRQSGRSTYNHSKPNGSASNHKTTSAPLSKGQGWVPENKKVNKADDPLLEQMNIIRSYIKEATIAHKYDEVASLQENLRELKNEYLKQHEESRSEDSSEVASLNSNEGGKDGFFGEAMGH